MSLRIILRVYSEFHETVTYAGAPYLIKMKVDYVQIINNLQMKRDIRNRPKSAKVDESGPTDVETVELKIGGALPQVKK